MMSSSQLKQRAQQVLQVLRARYPKPKTNLVANNPWQLLVATILSAQCTDARVNSLTPALFARWPGPRELAAADQHDLETLIKPAGFFHNKAKNLRLAAQRICEVFGGAVPRTLGELVTLAGVARKTANVVLFGAFGINEGLAVDTHVKRISYRLGLTEAREPGQIEQDLLPLFPREEWGNINHRMVWFGREICKARRPLCGDCAMQSFCPKREASD